MDEKPLRTFQFQPSMFFEPENLLQNDVVFVGLFIFHTNHDPVKIVEKLITDLNYPDYPETNYFRFTCPCLLKKLVKRKPNLFELLVEPLRMFGENIRIRFEAEVNEVLETCIEIKEPMRYVEYRDIRKIEQDFLFPPQEKPKNKVNKRRRGQTIGNEEVLKWKGTFSDKLCRYESYLDPEVAAMAMYTEGGLKTRSSFYKN
jgi:hypothetical protein